MTTALNRWHSMPCKRLYQIIDQRAGSDRPPLLAVSIHLGVVPRESITDNEPRADDLSDYKLCEPGDIVINRMRAFQGAIGISPQRGIVSPDYLVVRPESEAEARFLHHLFRSHWFVGEMVSRLRGIGSVDQGNVRTPRINPDDLGSIAVRIPSVAGQRTIADFLDSETARIDSLISKRNHMIELLRNRRSTIAAHAVSGKLSGDLSHERSSLPWLDERPSHWKEVLLRLVARLGSGHTPSREHPEWWVDCTIPWITTGEVQRLRSDRVEYIESTREMISEVGLANSSAELHSADTVVLCRTASAGYSGIMKMPMATSQDFATWTCGPLLRPRFLLLCLRVMRQDLLGRLAMGSTHQTIYMPDIRSIGIPLPPVNEQDEIVEDAWSHLTNVDRMVTVVERQIGVLQERRQALITTAVTGELPVPECVG